MRKSFGRSIVAGISVVLFLCSAVTLSLYQKDRIKGQRLRELAFFPSGRLIKTAVMGYDNFFADIYWIQSVQYIGEHLITNRSFPLLYHIYDVVTKLDPRFIDAYNFGALVLAGYGKNEQSAMSLLRLGIKRNPDNWQIPFQAGFINFTLHNNIEQALHYFKLARSKSDHPRIVDEYIAFLNEKQGNLHLSLKMWKDMYDKTEVPLTRTMCVYNILRLNIKIEEDRLREAVAGFKKKYHHPPDSLDALAKTMYINGYRSILPWKPFEYKPDTGIITAPRLTWQDVARYMSLNDEH
ncbi:MAG: hypothetical protein M1491_02665 [Deltaproteobacteria bacterium]|nr:hypothetical protein [Deltaproteobacteria bacterium]